ncbi:hypothetical protein [Caulobacter sp. LARHSG274]
MSERARREGWRGKLVDLLKDSSIGIGQAELDDLAGWEALFLGEWLRRHAATGGAIRQ